MEGRKMEQAMSEADARRDILEKRAFYGKYEQRLLGFLEGKGIHPLPNFTDGLSGTGALSDPAEGIGNAGEDRYLYLLRAGGRLYGLSCGGLLRDLTPGAGGKPLRLTSVFVSDIRSEAFYQQIAAASDGKYVYVLYESGSMEHTNPDLPREVPVMTHSEVLRAIWQPYFTEEQIRRTAAEYLSGRPPIFDVPFGSLELYYDQDAKVFFDVRVDGDYYHGYDVDCSRFSKGYAVALYNRHMMDYLRESCAEGDIPYGVMIDMFEEAPDDVKYDVPDDYYKKNFAHREINPEW